MQEVATGASPTEVWAKVVELQGKAKQAAAGDGQTPAADVPGSDVVTAALASVEPLDMYSGYMW